jgi:hypothetical protein
MRIIGQIDHVNIAGRERFRRKSPMSFYADGGLAFRWEPAFEAALNRHGKLSLMRTSSRKTPEQEDDEWVSKEQHHRCISTTMRKKSATLQADCSPFGDSEKADTWQIACFLIELSM